MATVITGVIVFILIILALVVVLLVAKNKLVSSGNVQIIINDDSERSITVPAGSTLLGTLGATELLRQDTSLMSAASLRPSRRVPPCPLHRMTPRIR